jgi:hypothetical protein
MEQKKNVGSGSDEVVNGQDSDWEKEDGMDEKKDL